jgi:hypothetical protein
LILFKFKPKAFFLRTFALVSLVSIVTSGTIGAQTATATGNECTDALRRVDPVPEHAPSAQPTIVIVDGYSSGRYLAPAFKSAGFQVIHVHSSGKPPFESFAQTFIPATYDFDFKRDPETDRTEATLLGQLSRFTQIVAVIPGADSGVLFAHRLSHSLKERFPELPINPLAAVLKNKFRMGERIKEDGLNGPLQLKTSRVDAAIQWVQAQKLFDKGGKVVVKPLKSGGTDGIFVCDQFYLIRHAFDQILNKPDELGQINKELLIQEYLQGTEYVVNTTSRDGHHHVTDMWVYRKRLSPDGKRALYDSDQLIPYEGEIQTQLIAYTTQVLNALSVSQGNAHTEIKMVPERGPVLIEMNHRMVGSGLPALVHLALGQSQVDTTLLAVKAPQAFKELPVGYRIQKHVAIMTLANLSGDKRNLASNFSELLAQLPGYHQHSVSAQALGAIEKGLPLPLTIDLDSSVADVWFAHQDEATLQQSMARLRELEKSGALFSPLK